RDLSWEGSFEDYLAVVKQHPQVTRNAFQRAYDMIIRYGIEEYTDNKKKRVILLHGPVGSSKSTIARLLKKGLEHYSTTPDGALYTFSWQNLDDVGMAGAESSSFRCPMHEEPLRLIPPSWRASAIKELGLSNPQFNVKVDG